MVEKFCSRSHGHPLPGVRSIAMISSKREISREGVIGHLPQEHQALCRKTRAHPSETNRTGGSFHPLTYGLTNAIGAQRHRPRTPTIQYSRPTVINCKA